MQKPYQIPMDWIMLLFIIHSMTGIIQKFPNWKVLSCFLSCSSNFIALRLRGRLFQNFDVGTLKDLLIKKIEYFMGLISFLPCLNEKEAEMKGKKKSRLRDDYSAFHNSWSFIF